MEASGRFQAGGKEALCQENGEDGKLFYRQDEEELTVSDFQGTFTAFGSLVQPTLALVGDDVLLSCHLSPKMDARGMSVLWSRGSLIVFLYCRGKEVEDFQAPSFQGRTKIMRQNMVEGKVTLIIHQVQLSDFGRYTCYFHSGTFDNDTSFDLQVAENPPTSQKTLHERIYIVIPVIFIGSISVISFFCLRKLQSTREQHEIHTFWVRIDCKDLQCAVGPWSGAAGRAPALGPVGPKTTSHPETQQPPMVPDRP
ncbi:myelin-oligodendrocyte glycoprotein-like [Macrotis lagotis]|uniref:myelin-oligodendrocyte glycoprotein-like n=1 Tax=Macrotis lagotis TaxID=92651 RepID=UPI003D69E5E7